MKPKPLKILCAFYNSEPDWLGTPPEEDLSDYEITCVHAYEDAKKCILDDRRGIPSFDIVLADISLPSGLKGETNHGPFPYCTILLQPYLDEMLVRGLGIFVPTHFESAFVSSYEYSVVVASKECWTPLGKRDWLSLLRLVLKASDEIEV